MAYLNFYGSLSFRPERDKASGAGLGSTGAIKLPVIPVFTFCLLGALRLCLLSFLDNCILILSCFSTFLTSLAYCLVYCFSALSAAFAFLV